jgi:3-deoxy-D-manno-octulosonic acid kinase
MTDPGNGRDPPEAMLIEPGLDRVTARAFFEARAAGTGGGARGRAQFLDAGGLQLVRKHYHRGGLVARLVHDRYLWLGEARVRAFAEFRLLARLHAAGLPVPRPLAARYRREGLSYRCDLVTERIEGAVPLSERLRADALELAVWAAIGRTLRELHRARVDHADLNAHNILLDAGGRVSLVDFDRSRLRGIDGGGARNLARLERSLRKVAQALPDGRFTDAAWNALLAGYRRGGG